MQREQDKHEQDKHKQDKHEQQPNTVTELSEADLQSIVGGLNPQPLPPSPPDPPEKREKQ